MAAINADSGSYPPEIIGYAEPWIAATGGSVAIKEVEQATAPFTVLRCQISCTESEYNHRTVRLIQGIDIDHSPEKAEEEVLEIPRGHQRGRFQTAQQGSYGSIPNWGAPNMAEGLRVSFYMQPWMVECSHAQTLISTLDPTTNTGFSITLNTSGSLDVRIGTKQGVNAIRTELRSQNKCWSKVKVLFTAKRLQVKLVHLPFRVEPVPPPAVFEQILDKTTTVLSPNPLLIAATKAISSRSGPGCQGPHVTEVFNGRIDRLTLKTHDQRPLVLAEYDFSLNMASDQIVDVSGRAHHGILINAPTRAVKGRDWDGSECDWTRAKSGYGAIHFHDDDMDDAQWDTDFVITIPRTARSGAYAVEVETVNGLDKDSITFFVRPNSWTSDNSSKVCLVFSTFTYLAYANERLYDTTRQNTADLGPGFDINKCLKSAEFNKMRRRSDLGLSCYDRHNDGSGVCYSSSKRPILNVREGYIMWAFSRPREFSADLMMLGFLEQQGIPYEIVTDHDLHVRGVAALQGLNTVITGSHPEYPTLKSYNAYNAFSKSGGNLMYMSGNGFYWVSGLDDSRPHRLEVRRGDTGVRPYSLPGGEHVNSLDGQRGALWRSRGMSCNTLFGVGFCAQGTGLGVPYRRTEASRDPSLSWMFDGIEGDLIGEYGFGGGASGDEIDRYDVRNGSPKDALVLATSTGHSDDFGIAIEDLSYPALNTLGTQTKLIRSDIVYYVGSGGGAVFSVGSINWYCSLAWDNYDNNVAKLTGNTIKGFLAGNR